MADDKDATLYLYDVATHERYTEVEVIGSDVFFPPAVGGWSDVLDCRHEPYDAHSVDENCEFADHVHKKYILVSGAQLDKQTPPAEE